tara:strand:+ start:97 stop:327 length:231 start_codon:yes stop_codon:yes gene_type:complete
MLSANNKRMANKTLTKLEISKVNIFILNTLLTIGTMSIARLESINNSPNLIVNTSNPTRGLLNISNMNMPIKKVRL